jgi:hypothetical protein
VKTIKEAALGELLWVQPARLTQEFELRDGDEVVGTLRWARPSLATGETANQSWTLKREGFWHPRITVRVPPSEDNIATFAPGWAGGGMLDLGSGVQLRFGAASFWHSQWDWIDAQNQPLVHFKSHQGLLKVEGQINIEAGAIERPDLPVLVVLGWYLLVLFGKDASAAYVAVSLASADFDD